MIYPWQTQQWQNLLQMQQTNRLPHALLLTGVAGVGKLDFTRAFLHRLFCQENDCYASQTESPCHACRMITQQTHPHLLWMMPEKKGQAIKIDQVRLINDFAYQSSFQQTYRVIIIHPAESMNINSANALLKTLEEPPLGCLFILVSDQANLLPITIRSRCQTVYFPVPEKKAALTWLEKNRQDTSISHELLLNIAKGAPILAANLSMDFLNNRKILLDALCLLNKNQFSPLQVASLLLESDFLFVLDMLLSWLIDIVKLQLNISMIVNQDYFQELSKLTLQISIHQIMELIIYLQDIRKEISQGAHLNKQLLLENSLIRYLQLNLNLNLNKVR